MASTILAKIAHQQIRFFILTRSSASATNYLTFSTEASRKEEEEFRVLELFPMKKDTKKLQKKLFSDAQILPPREKRMPINQDWVSVWPMPKTFRPSAVPLPIYQGYDQKRAPPGKYANAELIKIPNFLHLTPPAIKRHCAVLKQFCSDWPENLETEKDYEKHFPVEIITSDYCHASPTIRDERSKIITLQIKLSSLNLDYHGRDKLLRLIGSERYNKNTDMITIVADRCPLRKQNYDYLIYLLTALHHESWITELWEHEKTEADMEKFFFDNSRIHRKISETVAFIEQASEPSNESTAKKCTNSEKVNLFGEAVVKLLNEGENEDNIKEYKNSVINSLNLQP